MRRLLLGLGIALPLGVLVAFSVGDVRAELENQVFTSRPDRLRLVVPRGWRSTDQPSYPGVLLWMMRTQPEGRLVLTAEAFTRGLYCSWPVTCRTSHDSLPAKFACALRVKLQNQRMHVGPVQAGPKENEDAGLPSVWFEYDDGKHFLRQAVALDDEHAVSLVLSAPTADARTAHVRAFEQALRTLRPLTPEELGLIAAPGEPVPMQVTPSDAGAIDAGTLPDAAVGAAAGSAAFESAPAPKINPVGTCTQQ